MKKHFTIIKFLSLFFVLLTLCSCVGKDYDNKTIADNDKKLSDDRIASILKVIETKDTENLNKMFSEKAQINAIDFEKEVEAFFEKFDDTGLTFEDNAGPIVYDNTENGKKSKKLISWYDIRGEKTNYTIFFVEWIEDAFSKENVGLYTLRIIEEKDFDEQFIEHDKMEIAGIYYNP